MRRCRRAASRIISSESVCWSPWRTCSVLSTWQSGVSLSRPHKRASWRPRVRGQQGRVDAVAYPTLTANSCRTAVIYTSVHSSRARLTWSFWTDRRGPSVESCSDPPDSDVIIISWWPPRYSVFVRRWRSFSRPSDDTFGLFVLCADDAYTGPKNRPHARPNVDSMIQYRGYELGLGLLTCWQRPFNQEHDCV